MKFGFKEQMTLFVVFSATAFLVIYATCGKFSKVECHETVLGK